MIKMKNLIDRLADEKKLNHEQWLKLLHNYKNQDLANYLAKKARQVCDDHFGRNIFLRGLIEYTNQCENDCLYCGIRKSNSKLTRYRLSPDEILESCRLGRSLGLRTFLLQGGENIADDEPELLETVKKIRYSFPDCAISLSIGEKSFDYYKRLYEAGAERFLLRHESAGEEHYKRLHPPSMKLADRKKCLYYLKDLGYQLGAGFMVGSPWQTEENIVDDLLFLAELSPQMIGIGPFIPHPHTPLADFPPGSPELSVFILALLRLMLPKALLPASTALGTLKAEAREAALAYGANVIMPNLSPISARKKYEIYAGKSKLVEEAAEGLEKLKKRLAVLGYETPDSRGDSPGFTKDSI